MNTWKKCAEEMPALAEAGGSESGLVLTCGVGGYLLLRLRFDDSGNPMRWESTTMHVALNAVDKWMEIPK